MYLCRVPLSFTLCVSHTPKSLSLSLSLLLSLSLKCKKANNTSTNSTTTSISSTNNSLSLSLSLSLSRNTQYTHQNASLLRSTLDVGLSRRVRVGRLLSPSPSGEVLPFNSPCRGRPAQSQRQS